MIPATHTNLKKLEEILKEAGYTVRYEKGNFNSGYCVLEHKKVIVVNKYFLAEARMNTLLDLMSTIEIAKETLPDELQKFYSRVEEVLHKKSMLSNDPEH